MPAGGAATDKGRSPLPITWDFCLSRSPCEKRLSERDWAVVPWRQGLSVGTGSGPRAPQLRHGPAPGPVRVCPGAKSDIVFTCLRELRRQVQVWGGAQVCTRLPAPARAPTLRATRQLRGGPHPQPPPLPRLGAHSWPLTGAAGSVTALC